MGYIYTSADQLIGKTPLLELSRLEREEGLEARILAKLEYFNPAGSTKDRVAKAMIDDAEARGLLGPGSVIIEPTSGNTGIGLASVAAARGYRTIIVMPETMSMERRLLMGAYGAELVLTEGARGMAGAITRAEELAKEIPGSFIPGQFTNPANPAAHRASTGPEIWEDTDGQVDVFVAGIGTGGTITGTGRYLKRQNPKIKVIAVEPASCPSLTRGVYAYDFCDTGMVCPLAKMYTLGSGFIPSASHSGGLRYHGMSPVLSQLYHDGLMEAVSVKQTEVFEAAVQFARVEGILPAPESSHAIRVAIDEALKCRQTGEEKTIVFGLTGTGYFDMMAYEKHNNGTMADYIPTDDDLKPGLTGIPRFPGNEF